MGANGSRLSKYTRVEPTETFRALHPKSRVKWGVIVGHSRDGMSYRVKWDGHTQADTLSPRLIKVKHDSEGSAKHDFE